MKGLALVDEGLESIALKEIKEKIGSNGKKESRAVIFPIKNKTELCKLAYTSQSIRRLMLLLSSTKIGPKYESAKKTLEKEFKKIDLKSYAKQTIMVECERIGDHDFTSVDIAQHTSKILHGSGFDVHRKEYDLIIYIYINEKQAHISIDYSGRDLSKRDYRIFTKSGSIKGTLAYSLLRFADYKPGEVLLNPYCESGEIAIEAALYALNKPINYYKKEFAFQKLDKKFTTMFSVEDKKTKNKVKNINSYDKQLSSVNNAKKNAKVAGVEKNINFSKVDLEWLDTKFEKETVDKIICKLPSESKRLAAKIVEKIYKEFFYQAEYILKPKGIAVICSLKDSLLLEWVKKSRFKIKEKKVIYSGDQSYHVTIMQKNLKK